MKKLRREKIEFLCFDRPGRQVFVAGTFNQWDPGATPMADPNRVGEYSATVCVPHGAHEYKFIVDGAWRHDTDKPDRVRNRYGTLNSWLFLS